MLRFVLLIAVALLGLILAPQGASAQYSYSCQYYYGPGWYWDPYQGQCVYAAPQYYTPYYTPYYGPRYDVPYYTPYFQFRFNPRGHYDNRRGNHNRHHGR